MGILFYGKTIAQEIHESIKSEIANIKERVGIEPTMAMIKLDKEDSLKMAEVRLHTNIANQLGIRVKEFVLDPQTPEAALIELIQQCNADPTIHGILVLLPLPDHIDQDAVLLAISKEKELEGLTGLEGKESNVLSALMRILKEIDFNIFKNNCVFLSDESTLKYNAVIKKVLEKAISLKIAVTPVTKEAANVHAVTRKADLLAVSLQTPEIIDKEYIKDDAVVIDFNPILMGEKFCEKRGVMVPIIKSSLNVDSLLARAKYVLPATGGIGPVTLASLMRNFLYNYKRATFAKEID
jgi:methylenetetrahydrofolate dehydrogenase (NADP+)/methenyltetrahydrofolate cyclohydrolase